jgi:hypothetical protein
MACLPGSNPGNRSQPLPRSRLPGGGMQGIENLADGGSQCCHEHCCVDVLGKNVARVGKLELPARAGCRMHPRVFLRQKPKRRDGRKQPRAGQVASLKSSGRMQLLIGRMLDIAPFILAENKAKWRWAVCPISNPSDAPCFAAGGKKECNQKKLSQACRTGSKSCSSERWLRRHGPGEPSGDAASHTGQPEAG